jgi:hypothetical protein
VLSIISNQKVDNIDTSRLPLSLEEASTLLQALGVLFDSLTLKSREGSDDVQDPVTETDKHSQKDRRIRENVNCLLVRHCLIAAAEVVISSRLVISSNRRMAVTYSCKQDGLNWCFGCLQSKTKRILRSYKGN